MSLVLKAWEGATQTLYQHDRGPRPDPALAWQTATRELNATNVIGQPQGTQLYTREVRNAVDALEAAELKDELLTWYLVVQHAVVEFLDQYDRQLEQMPEECPFIASAMLHRIGEFLAAWRRPVELIWRDTESLLKYQHSFLSSLYSALPQRFAPALTTYLRSLLHSPDAFTASHPLAMPTLILLLDRYDPLLFGLIYEEIEKKVERDCKDEFTEGKLTGVLEWLTGPVMEWVAGIYAREGENAMDEAKKMLKPTFSRFEYHVHKTLGLLRSTELFDIIVDFPESKPALEDLKICMFKTDQRSIIVTRLRALMARRLLHPGAGTKDIITSYISTIRCLRILDPQGVLLSRVADPIRKYLRSREDTIRCIVSSLIEEGNELVAELAASDAKVVRDSKDEAENFNDPKWTPDPVDAPPDFRKSKGSDIIQLLVSIYDTKDVFIKELQVLLAQRLLAIKDYALDREIKNVEILKMRFGEASLQGCEVMIKDLQDSKRTDHFVQDDKAGPLHATIVSRLFWPSFQNASLKLPGQLGKAQSQYEKSYNHLKPDKKLKWLPQLGTANITVELKDRTITIDATAIQASIIELFSIEDTWSADDLIIELRTDSASLRNGLYFWSNQGVIKNVDPVEDTWKLLEEKESGVTAGLVMEEAQEAVQSVDSQKIEQMRVHWQYMQGMLLNLGVLPLTRIHNTLNMLVPSYKGRTTDELEAFLEAMAGEGLVEKVAKGWKIIK
ncbi:anaphase-promoting complex subunit 2 [Pseudohyphozyma bogoriensis]|nr:anaphase-promoting complex subunit 2 [Pseudohyphozyma bogoriensis]